MLSKIKTTKSVNCTDLDFSEIYLKYFTKIKSHIRSLDRVNHYARNTESMEDVTQGFFVEIFEKNILSKFDTKRAAGKDPILTFLRNYLRNFYRLQYNKEIKNNKISNELSNFAHTNVAKHNDKNFMTNTRNQEEGLNFCYDVKKLSKFFVRSLKGLERKAWKYFIYDQSSASKVAQELGITGITASRLKKTILMKAKNDLGNYYA